MKYPKVLILNCTFDSLGSGVTVKNLFRSWPAIKLGNAHSEIKKKDVCGSYYQIGCDPDDYSKKTQIIDLKSYKNNIFKKLTIGLKKHLELKHIINKKHLDKDLVAWIKKGKFDVIYFVLFEARDIPFLVEVKKKIELPVAVHIFDNWVEHNRFGFFGFLFAPFLMKDFRRAIEISDICLSISKEMKDVYEERYGKTFHVFHNPSKDYYAENPKIKRPNPAFIITFVGTIGEHNVDIFEKIGVAIKKLKKEKIEIELKFIGYIRKSYISDRIRKIDSIKIYAPKDHKDISKELVNSDILLLPLSFDPSQKKYIMYSIPTKTAEYMASGVPILVLAPGCFSLTRYAKRDKWAMVITDCRVDKITDGIKQLCENKKLQEYYRLQSRKIFLSNHKVEDVSYRLRRTLNDYLANG